jgi:hypothetical protein
MFQHGTSDEAPGRDHRLLCLNRKRGDVAKWQIEAFLRLSDTKLTNISPAPQLAHYFAEPWELIYNTSMDLRVDANHIIDDNLHRFPDDMTTNKFALAQALNGTIEDAKKRVKRNYKTAIPHWYRGALQLMLPLCLRSPDEADLALVVSQEQKVYKGWTVLTLEMAYNNARLIARPDREWLQP